MSFGFRDKDRPSLRDRLRGKSGDQILEELRRKLDKDKEMFFERGPNPPSFRRTGFPFDDDGLAARSRPDFRHRLEELAQQHPEFADSLRPWYDQQQQPQQQPTGDMGWGFRQRTGSNSSQPQGSAHGSPQPQTEQQEPQAPPQASAQAPQQCAPQHQQGDQQARGIAHHGLRNTVDLGEATQQMESQEERNKRAQSAPPAPDQQGQGGQGQPGQRFVSRLEINPEPANNQDPAAAKPPPGPKQTQQTQGPKSSGSNVRQIPIFVEGRDEPVIAKDDVDSSANNFGQGFAHHPFSSHHQGFSRPGMHDNARFGDTPRTFPSFHSREQFDHEAPAQKRPFPQQHHQPPSPPTRQAHPAAHPTNSAAHPQAQPHPQPQKTQQQQPSPQQTPPQQRQQTPPREQTKPKDALEKVKDVQIEVESLAKQVEEFSGTRQDKHYIFLDEMLTRELIKLDVIETDGRDDVRAARKETIRSIQQCISKLEAKASGEQPMELEQQQQQQEAMEVEASSQSGDTKTESQEVSQASASADPAPSPAPATTPAPAAEPSSVTAPSSAEPQASSQVTDALSSSTDSKPQPMDTTPVSVTPSQTESTPAPAAGSGTESASVS